MAQHKAVAAANERWAEDGYPRRPRPYYGDRREPAAVLPDPVPPPNASAPEPAQAPPTASQPSPEASATPQQVAPEKALPVVKPPPPGVDYPPPPPDFEGPALGIQGGQWIPRPKKMPPPDGPARPKTPPGYESLAEEKPPPPEGPPAKAAAPATTPTIGAYDVPVISKQPAPPGTPDVQVPVARDAPPGGSGNGHPPMQRTPLQPDSLARPTPHLPDDTPTQQLGDQLAQAVGQAQAATAVLHFAIDAQLAESAALDARCRASIVAAKAKAAAAAAAASAAPPAPDEAQAAYTAAPTDGAEAPFPASGPPFERPAAARPRLPTRHADPVLLRTHISHTWLILPKMHADRSMPGTNCWPRLTGGGMRITWWPSPCAICIGQCHR